MFSRCYSALLLTATILSVCHTHDARLFQEMALVIKFILHCHHCGINMAWWNFQNDDAAVEKTGGSLYAQNLRLMGRPPPTIMHG